MSYFRAKPSAFLTRNRSDFCLRILSELFENSVGFFEDSVGFFKNYDRKICTIEKWSIGRWFVVKWCFYKKIGWDSADGIGILVKFWHFRSEKPLALAFENWIWLSSRLTAWNSCKILAIPVGKAVGFGYWKLNLIIVTVDGLEFL